MVVLLVGFDTLTSCLSATATFVEMWCFGVFGGLVEFRWGKVFNFESWVFQAPCHFVDEMLEIVENECFLMIFVILGCDFIFLGLTFCARMAISGFCCKKPQK